MIQSHLSHDMPDQPVAKARVYKTAEGWRWEHVCVYRNALPNISTPKSSQALAFAGAMVHMRWHCA